MKYSAKSGKMGNIVPNQERWEIEDDAQNQERWGGGRILQTRKDVKQKIIHKTREDKESYFLVNVEDGKN